MMTKWDTIQADVSDAYIGLEENLQWEEAIADDPYYFNDEDEEPTLDWNE